MGVSILAVAVMSLAVGQCHAFQPLHVTSSRTSSLMATSSASEFAHLLGESSHRSVGNTGSRRVITVASEETRAILTSTTSEKTLGEENTLVGEAEFDPFSDIQVGLDEGSPTMVTTQQYEQSIVQRIGNEVRNMDMIDFVSTMIVPSILTFVTLRWSFNRLVGKVSGSRDTLLSNFATEMVYHDGDLEELRLCHAEYAKKLVWLGPQRMPSMLKRYLELYAKKKAASPKGISSISYVFDLFDLTELKAAEVLVSLCRSLGDEHSSSINKLLYFGSRIFKTPEGLAALEPIKDMIKATYRGEKFADTLVENSQYAMAEAAYRNAVLAAGKNQTTLTPGWEIAGIDKEAATRLFEDCKEDGFLNDIEQHYAAPTERRDSRGRLVDSKGVLINPDGDGDDDGGVDDDAPTSNVFECSNCGYTLFVAEGRESKFFGSGFKCPECGAAKDDFKPGDLSED